MILTALTLLLTIIKLEKRVFYSTQFICQYLSIFILFTIILHSYYSTKYLS